MSCDPPVGISDVPYWLVCSWLDTSVGLQQGNGAGHAGYRYAVDIRRRLDNAAELGRQGRRCQVTGIESDLHGVCLIERHGVERRDANRVVQIVGGKGGGE